MNIDKQSRAYSVPKKIKLPSIEHPIESEFLIPEYCPDIIKILRCDINSTVMKKKITDDLLELDICSEITIIFCGTENKISSVITKYNFTKSIENKEFINNTVSVSLSKNYLNCRQTSARRIDIKGALNIDVTINSFDAIDVICDIQRDDIEILRNNLDVACLISTKEKQIIIEDELLLSSSNPDVNYIIRQKAIPTITECKLIGEKAVVKGNVKIEVLYCSIEEKTAYFSEIIPFSQIIEIENADKTCKIIPEIDLSGLSIKPIISNSANAGFLVEIGLNIILKSCCNLDLQMILDCYSIKNKVETTKEKISFNKLEETLTEKFVFKKNINLNETQILSVIDFWGQENKIDASINGDEANFCGNIDGSLLFINVDNSPEYHNVKIDFDFCKKFNENLTNTIFESEFFINNCSYRLVSDNQIEIQIEVIINAEIYKKVEIDVLKEVIDLEKPVDNNESIIIYYSTDEEDVWSVAKRFSTPLQVFKEQNNLVEDTIDSQSVLVISRMWGNKDE